MMRHATNFNKKKSFNIKFRYIQTLIAWLIQRHIKMYGVI